MNIHPSVNLLNILTQPQPLQPIHSIQFPVLQPLSVPQSPSIIGHGVRIQNTIQSNQLLQAINAQRLLSSYPSPSHINCIKPEHYTNFVSLNPYAQTHPILQLTTNPNYNINAIHMVPPGLPIKQSLEVAQCPSAIHCPSIKRIVKLGVLQTKYGVHNGARMAEFIDQCPEYKHLNDDYQHFISCHMGTVNKHKIDEMSKEYGRIYDFIDNFKTKHGQIVPHQPRLVSVGEIVFYNNTMDTMYGKMATKPEHKHQPMKIEIVDLIGTDDRMNTDTIGDDNSSRSSNTTTSQILPPSWTTLPIQNNPNNNSITSNINMSNAPLFAHAIPSHNLPPSIRPQSITFSPIQKPIVPRIPRLHQTGKPKIEPQQSIPVRRTRRQADRKFKCNTCGKQYKHLCNLKSHQKVHTDEALVCPHCSKRFGRKANYKEHIRIHTGETPYECRFCQRKFKHHHSWKDHIRIHTGEKPYKCTVCSKKFKVGHNLTVHLRIHTGEKPYNCSVCMKAFRQKSALNSHLKRVHS